MITLYPTKRKAVNAARKAYGACRFGDVCAVHSTAKGYGHLRSVRFGTPHGFIVAPRDTVGGWSNGVRALSVIPEGSDVVLIPVPHDTLKG
jgi:hypothetical protein